MKHFNFSVINNLKFQILCSSQSFCLERKISFETLGRETLLYNQVLRKQQISWLQDKKNEYVL